MSGQEFFDRVSELLDEWYAEKIKHQDALDRSIREGERNIFSAENAAGLWRQIGSEMRGGRDFLQFIEWKLGVGEWEEYGPEYKEEEESDTDVS